MRVLVTGASGFIGAYVVAALIRNGHQVVGASCSGSWADNRHSAIETLKCDFSNAIRVSDWLPRLTEIDAIINCAGILRPGRRGTFDDVHYRAPKALFDACKESGVRRVIQISALGNPELTDFVRSKHKADSYLQTLDLDWTIVRPSLVYSTTGSYGGTSILRALAALPGIVPLIDGGRQQIQPLSAEDLAEFITGCLGSQTSTRRVLEAVGPEKISFRSYVESVRSWLGFGTASYVSVPIWLAGLVAWFSDLIARGPVGMTMLRMLEDSNVGSATSHAELEIATGVLPVSVEDSHAFRPSQVQDRWHARLYFLRPTLRIALAALWIYSGLVGIVLQPVEFAIERTLALGIGSELAPVIVFGTSALNLVLGLFLLLQIRVIAVGILMLLSVIGYTLVLTVFQLELWLDLFGSIAKNIPIAVSILVMLAIERQR